ncbi:MAG: zf-HC2 domain-containing protein [Candidatus Marinimicrobia bacterium]|nr:zf-HC2 domain-containing protein [Candidatus Neomarinimicrobiota bacterium]MCF7904436.1 zf-HC2 domain-containing protein [Candidatus Neomarinimicrobiota bacterium]
MQNSDCGFIRNQYTEFKDNTLTPETKAEVDTHLAECHACQKVFTELDQALSTMHSMETVQASPNFTTTLLSKISDSEPAGVWQRLYNSSYTKVAGYAIAAGMVVAIGLNFIIDPVSGVSGGNNSNFTIEQQVDTNNQENLVGASDSALMAGNDSLNLNSKTINSGSSTLQLVNGGN